MALTEQLRSLAQKMLTPGGFLGDIPGVLTYYSASEGASSTYNPLTGAVTRNESVGVDLTGVFTDPHYRQLDNINVFPNDKFFIIAGDAFIASGLSYRRKPGDRLVSGTENWEVVDIRTDPIYAAFILHVRKP